MKEIWKSIEGYEGLYDISIDGKVKSLKRTKKGKGNGILPVKERIMSSFYKDGLRERVSLLGKKYFVHILVAQAFPEICGEYFEGCEVHHIDRNPSNNNAYNLVVMTHEQHKLEHYDERVERNSGINNNFFGKHVSQQNKERISLANSIPVVQFTLGGEFVAEHKSGVEASRVTDATTRGICMCCKGKQKTSGGYIWRYREDI